LKQKCPHVPSVHSSEKMETLRVTIQQSLRKSTRQAAAELGIS